VKRILESTRQKIVRDILRRETIALVGRKPGHTTGDLAYGWFRAIRPWRKIGQVEAALRLGEILRELETEGLVRREDRKWFPVP
jgi:hypothetical protein